MSSVVDFGAAEVRTTEGHPESPQRSRRRIGTWFSDPGGWVTVLFALYTLAFVVWVGIGGGSGRTRTIVSDAAFLPITLVAAALAWRAAAHPALDTATRRAWRLIGLSYLAWWVGDALWFFYEVVRNVQPFPSWADAGYLSFYPLLLVGLLSFRVRSGKRPDRLKLILDAGTVLVGGGMAVWYLVIEPTVKEHEAHLLNKLLSLAYPMGDMVVVFGIAVVLLRRPALVSTAALRVLVAGAAVFVVADVAYAHLSLSDAYKGGDWPDAGWMVALFLLMAAAQTQRWLAASGSSVEERVEERRVVTVSKLPYLALAVGYTLLLVVGRQEAVPPLSGLLLGALILTGLVAARQMTAQKENLRLMAELQLLAVTDSLTGLHNRRSFFDLGGREWDRAARLGEPLSALMVDVDHFKSVNDTAGHAAGDEVLAQVARRCQEELRSIDVLGRYGGDELAALLPATQASDAVVVAMRLRNRVASSPVETDDGPVEVSVSVGVATAGPGTFDLATLLSRADNALYQAKQEGRNRVASFRGPTLR